MCQARGGVKPRVWCCVTHVISHTWTHTHTTTSSCPFMSGHTPTRGSVGTFPHVAQGCTSRVWEPQAWCSQAGRPGAPQASAS
eukprot:scaffold141870_cov304-Phaeocystis_antarctica.AAC.1